MNIIIFTWTYLFILFSRKVYRLSPSTHSLIRLTNWRFGLYIHIMKDISKKIKPLSDRIVIKEHTDTKEKKTASGIIIPVGVGQEKGSMRGNVVATGPGRMEEGKIVSVTVKIGDEVLFQWGEKVKVDGEDYYIVREGEVLAIIK